MQILGVPIPGYALLYAPKLMPAINFDVFHFIEKYWRNITLFDYVKNVHLLGVNLVVFGYDSVHFIDNTRSTCALTLALLFILLIFSWRLRNKKSRRYMFESILIIGKTICYMVFVMSSAI